MKSLYESILSSTRSGASGLKELVIEWAKNSDNFRYVKEYTIDAKPKGDGWILYIDSDWLHVDTKSFEIGMKETNGTGKIPFNIHSVYINGKLARIAYRRLVLTENDICKESSGLNFISCTLKNVKSLPKNCRSLSFVYGHNLGGGSGTRVQEIKNISLDNFYVICSGDRSGLHCLLSSIKGLEVKNKMQISDGMLGYNSLMRGNKKFTPEASDLLDSFFEENKVKPEQCEFLPCNNKLKYEKAKIYKDDKAGCWKIGDIIE